MSKLLSIALSILLVAIAKGDDDMPLWSREFDPTALDPELRSSDEEVFRLPCNVEPLEYDVFIDLYFAEKTDNPYSYDGRVFITIQAKEDQVREIVLHSNVDRINKISLTTANNVPVNLNKLQPFSLEPEYHFLKIHLDEEMAVGANYTLFIDYSSTMNEGPMKRGIWRGWYTDANGDERIYATTHFQPYNARQAFPCWDEPFFKAVFNLHLSRPVTYVGTFANTGVESTDIISNERVQDNFKASPKMSSYLVTFLVSESFQVIAEDTSFTPPIRIIGRSNTAGLADHALELAVGMTKHFDEYFQMPYESLHPNLMNDHVSSPDWASAGTENWGMVSYRELNLIIDPEHTIMSVEHYATTLVSHELAHKWFGNLITCHWWSNTWINEGYASYFGYIAGHAMFPKYELHEHFNSRYLQTSLAFDSGTGTVPMNHEVNTPAQVTGHFGTISYSKGASFLRMTVDIISEETFRKSCQIFLAENAFEPTNQYDLYNAFKKAIDEDGSIDKYGDFDFEEYYRVWVNEPGYPMLDVKVNEATGMIVLEQERFFLSATATPTGQIYPIPITYNTQANNYFENITPVAIMSTKTLEIPKPDGDGWIMFNNLQHGHYRVMYEDSNWRLITEALLANPSTFHHLSRAQIVDDVFAFMRSGKMTYGFGLNILRYLARETNFHVWDPAITGFTWLRNRLRHLPEKQAQFDAYILSNLEHVINQLGFDVREWETPTVSLTRQAILHFACTVGHKGCIQESYDRFLAMMNGEWIDPRIRRSVYVTGMREGDVSHYAFLLTRYRQSNFANDQLEMLRGLAASRDPTVLNLYLTLTLGQYVRTHDKVNAFNYALLGNQDSAYTVLQFVKNNIDAIRVAYIQDSPARPVHTALSNLAAYLDEAGLLEYEEWLRSTQSTSQEYATAMSAITSARNNIAWGTANAEILIGALPGSAGVAVASMSMILVTVTAMLL